MDLHATTLSRDDHDASIPSLSAEGTSEAVSFLMSMALDSTARTKLRRDKDGFLNESELSEEAKALLAAPDSNMLLAAINQPGAEMLVVVVLETVTTDIIVV